MTDEYVVQDKKYSQKSEELYKGKLPVMDHFCWKAA